MCQTCGCSSKKVCEPMAHASHMCDLMAKKTPIAELKKVVKGAQYLCAKCGRAAAKEENLCAPEKL